MGRRLACILRGGRSQEVEVTSIKSLGIGGVHKKRIGHGRRTIPFREYRHRRGTRVHLLWGFRTGKKNVQRRRGYGFQGASGTSVEPQEKGKQTR